MAFNGNYFILDNISSERYGLKMTTVNNDKKINVSSYKSNRVKPIGQSKYEATKQFDDEPSDLVLTIYSEKPIPRQDIDIVEKWLFKNTNDYRKLYIIQDDMSGFYYNCRLRKLEVETIFDMPYLVNCAFERDSIYVWENVKTINISPTTLPHSFRFINNSSESTMKPIYEFTCNKNNGEITLKDTTTNEELKLINLQENEKIVVNSETLIVTSDKRLLILDNFNLNFMRLTEGVHNFELNGDVSNFKMTYQNARKIGD